MCSLLELFYRSGSLRVVGAALVVLGTDRPWYQQVGVHGQAGVAHRGDRNPGRLLFHCFTADSPGAATPMVVDEPSSDGDTIIIQYAEQA